MRKIGALGSSERREAGSCGGEEGEGEEVAHGWSVSDEYMKRRC